MRRFSAKGRHKPGTMNGTEKWYANILDQRKIAGDVLDYWFESIKFKLAEATFYTPDFAVLLSSYEMEIHEVKGFWQDDARVKIKVAAGKFPFRFRAIQKGKGGVVIEEVFSGE